MKPSGKGRRLVAAYIKVNAATIKHSYPMPTEGQLIAAMSGTKCFGGFDGVSNFWQYQLHPDSYHLFAFQTHQGIFIPLRVPQGSTDSAAIAMAGNWSVVGSDLRWKNIRVDMDDFMVKGGEEEEYLDALEEFLKRCEERRLKISASEAGLFVKKVRWLGKEWTADGVQHDATRIEVLGQVRKPRDA
jgi:hypothetical protein